MTPFSLTRVKDQVTHLAFAGVGAWGRGAQFFQWYLAGVEQFLTESSLSWALFLILWLERTAFLSSTLSSTYTCWCFCSCCLLQTWEIWSKAKTQGDYQDVIPWVLRFLANLPPSLSGSYVSFICNFQGFSFTKQAEWGKIHLVHLHGRGSLYILF